jgi:SAM-dependent methyltransferase
MKDGSELGVGGDLIYDAGLYDGLNTFGHDIPFYLDLARKARGPVLELCCGTGRITLPLLERGLDVTGVDYTPSMLAGARRKAAGRGLRGKFVKGDMRTLRLGKKFKLVFIPFNSLQHIYTLADAERVFATVRAHLAPGGRFAFDVFNPSIHYMVRFEKLKKGKFRFELADGRRVVIDEVCRYDPARQVNRVTWIHHIGGGAPRARKLDMRCFYPLELEALLKYNGFRVLGKYGDYAKAPFTAASMKQIFVCEKS